MTLYIEEFTNKTKFSKVAGYEINYTEISCASVTNNKLSEIDTKKSTPITNVLRIKYLGEFNQGHENSMMPKKLKMIRSMKTYKTS